MAPANHAPRRLRFPTMADTTSDHFVYRLRPGRDVRLCRRSDPTSIRGTSGQGAASPGSVSGVELIGATVTLHFSDGTIRGPAIPDDELAGGSQNILKGSPLAAPSIEALGITAPATVTSAAQTIRVTGPVGAAVRLVRIEADLNLNGGAGFDLDPFEANSAIAVGENNPTIGAGGFVDVAVTLTRTDDVGPKLLRGSRGVGGRQRQDQSRLQRRRVGVRAAMHGEHRL